MFTDVQEIDLDSFFGPESEVPQGDLQASFVNDLDLDQAINNALKEIDENSNTTALQSTNSIQFQHQHAVKSDYHSTPNFIRTPTPPPQSQHYSAQPQYSIPLKQQQKQIKPLSPASLYESRSPQTPSVSEFEMTKMKELYEQKCKELETAMNELKKSEKKRFVLMKENKKLKETVVKMSMDL